MNAWTLVNILTSACSPEAEFMAGSHVWWVPASGRYSSHPKGYLVISPNKPAKDAIDLTLNENGPMKVGL